MSNAPTPEQNPRLAAVLASPTGHSAVRRLREFTELVQDPEALDGDLLRLLEDDAGGPGLIDCLTRMKDEFTAISEGGAENLSRRDRARRFAHALSNVIEALEEIHTEAASRLAGIVRDRLITLDDDGDDDALAADIRRAATAYMTR